MARAAGIWSSFAQVAVVLVPLPHVAVEGLLAVDLELVHVHVLAEQLDDRLHHARMARQLGEG